jgi:hypothetical protein
VSKSDHLQMITELIAESITLLIIEYSEPSPDNPEQRQLLFMHHITPNYLLLGVDDFAQPQNLGL